MLLTTCSHCFSQFGASKARQTDTVTLLEHCVAGVVFIPVNRRQFCLLTIRNRSIIPVATILPFTSLYSFGL
jgi:hypothetical protein